MEGRKDCKVHDIVSCSLLVYSSLLTNMASPSSTDGRPSMMNSHCHPFSPPRPCMDMSPAARGAANTTLTTLARVTAVNGLVRLQEACTSREVGAFGQSSPPVRMVDFALRVAFCSWGVQWWWQCCCGMSCNKLVFNFQMVCCAFIV